MANPELEQDYYEDAPDGQQTWFEPQSPVDEDNPPVYPHCKVWETESGHSIQMDDTKNRERVRIQHRSKTFLEMHPNGDQVCKVYGDNYEITIKDKNVLIKGSCSVTIEGDATFNVKGNRHDNVDGDYYLNVTGNYYVNGKKNISLTSDNNMNLNTGNGITGRLTLGAASYTINGDLTVTGSIKALAVTAETKISAGTNVNAGPYGFTSLTGGLSLGFPTIAPIGCINVAGGINAVAPIISESMVMAPIIQGGVVSDLLGSMEEMRLQYNAHSHPGHVAGGPTIQMI